MYFRIQLNIDKWNSASIIRNMYYFSELKHYNYKETKW